MLPLPAGREASLDAGAFVYERHRPEQTLLYQIIEQHYPDFLSAMEAQGRPLPGYVQNEFDAFLQCGRLEQGFLRLRCEDCKHEHLIAFSCKRRGFCPRCGARRMVESAALLVDDVFPREPIRQWVLSFPFQLRFLFASYPELMGKVLGIVYRTLATHIIHKAGFTKSTAHTGAVTLIQRFGSALNLNLHFHRLYLDGVYVEDAHGKVRFHRIKAPTAEELGALVHRISQRVAKFLERRGFLARDEDNDYLTLETSQDETMQQLYGHSITYRIAIGPHQGRKVFTLQSLPPVEEPKAGSSRVAKVAGFSLHAGVMAEAYQRGKLERLCRYIARPAVSEKRLSLLDDGRIRYELKTPYRDGTTHVMLLRASCPSPFGPAFGCSQSLRAIVSSRWTSWPGLRRWYPTPVST
jgi:ribosomal protein S27E